MNPYDALPYPGGTQAFTHPERLAVLARLRGLDSPPPAQARILEIGSALGRNLAPIAESLPGADCLGLDYSPVQVDLAQRWLRLPNLRYLCADIAEPSLELGQFDYILCHGVYSWVPPAVQQAILSRCQRHLAPNGVATISYNALPGWHLLRVARDLIQFHAKDFASPQEQVAQARAAIQFARQGVGDDPSAYATLLRELARDLPTRDDAYIFHEHLSPYNEPLYLSEFLDRAGAQGLQLLTDADLSTVSPGTWPPETAELLRQIGGGQVQTEQYMDFMRSRSFRRTVLCHSGLRLDAALRPERLRGLYIGAAFVPGEEPDTFLVQGRGIHAGEALVSAALRFLGRAWPGLLPYEALLAQAQAALGRRSPGDDSLLGNSLLGCALHGLLELRLSPQPWSTSLPQRPCASRSARTLADQAPQVPTLAHKPLMLSRPLERALLPLLDGTRDVQTLTQALGPEVPNLLSAWQEAQLFLAGSAGGVPAQSG